MRICGQNPRTDADATFQDPHISGLCSGVSDRQRLPRRSACVVRFRPEQICAVTDSVSSADSSGRFVRSLVTIESILI